MKGKIFLFLAVFLWCICCAQAATTAVRTMPDTFIPGGSLQVNISVSTDAISPPAGVIINEILPEGWVITSSSPDYIRVIGSTYTWLMYNQTGVPSFVINYTVRVPSSATGTYQFTGTVTTAAEGKQSIGGNQITTQINTVIQPVFSPAPKIYYSPVSVSMSCQTPEATIRYTLDGSEPTTSSTVYTGPVFLSTTTTVRAKGYKTGLNPSSTAAGTYTIQIQPGSLSGIVTYEGNQTGEILVHLYTTSYYSDQPVFTRILTGPGAYQFSPVSPGTYYPWAFLDTNADGLFDGLGEPSGEYGNPVVVNSGQSVTSINFSLLDPREKKGDINFDGNITVTDVINFLRIIACLPVKVGQVNYSYPYPQSLLRVTDANSDGKIDLLDLIFILRLSVDLK